MSKKKIVLRCVSCGVKATKVMFGAEAVCNNIACHEVVKEAVKSFIADNKNKK